MRLGVHCSIRHGYIGAVQQATALGCCTMQFFSHSPRIWRFPRPSAETIASFRVAWRESGMHPLIVHVAYLPNPASDDPGLRARSVAMLRDEAVLARRLGADYLVVHPGSHGETMTRETGLRRLAAAIDSALRAAPDGPMILLEQVCGHGRKLGSSFAEIAEIIAAVRMPERVGLCVDTAHVHASGYDLSTVDGLDRLVGDIARTVGTPRLRLLHLNDSRAPVGSAVDRHEHIGAGSIGIEGFRRILAHPLFRDLPGILETPKEAPFGALSDADRRNLRLLESLAGATVRKVLVR